MKDYSLANLFVNLDGKTLNFTGIDSRISFSTLKHIVQDVSNIEPVVLAHCYVVLGSKVIHDETDKLVDHDIKSDTTVHMRVSWARLHEYNKNNGITTDN